MLSLFSERKFSVKDFNRAYNRGRINYNSGRIIVA